MSFYYPCTGNEPVFYDIELLDAEGNVVNTIVSSECFAAWYAPQVGYTWRHRPVPEPSPDPEEEE